MANPLDLIRALRDIQLGAGEVIGTVGTGMIAQPLAGIYGVGTALRHAGKGKAEALRRAQENIGAAQEAMTYQPRTDTGRRGLENIAKVIDPISTALRENVADPVGAVSPLAGAALVALPDALPGPGKAKVPKVKVPKPELPAPGGSTLLDVPQQAAVVETPTPEVKARVKKQPKAVFSVFEDVTDPQVARAMAMRDAHLKVDPNTGKYVGAPDWVDSPQALGTMRRDALEGVRKGIFNADWYDRQRAMATALADEPARQSLFARGTAAYSPQSMPKVELPQFLRQHNEAMLTGETAQPRTIPQMRNVARAYEGETVDPTKIKLSLKTGPYGEAKDPTVPAESLFKAPSDIWHGRLMGYPGIEGKPFSRGFKGAETGFLTGENLRLTEAAKAEGLPVGDVKGAQAAAWGTVRETDLRAEDAARFAEQTKLRERYERNPEAWRKRNPGKSAPPKPAPVRTPEELRAYASEGLDTAEPRQTATLTSEAVPGNKTGHLAGMDEATKAKYTADILRATGRDPVVERLGLFSRKPAEGRGIYQNEAGVIERNPSWADPVMVSNVGDSNVGIRTPGIEREALDIAARTSAYLRGQESSGWNRFLPETMSPRVGQMNAARVKGLTPAEADQLVAAGLSPVDVGGGTAHITRFGNEGPISGAQADVQQLVPRAERGTMETGHEPGIPAAVGTGEATGELISAYERSKIANLPQRMGAGSKLPTVAQAYNEIDRALAAEKNLPVREDLIRARDIIAQGGIPALIAHVRKFGAAGLPVVVLGMLGLQQENNELASTGT